MKETKMSKLEELIKELCPNGVKYINLVEVTDIHKGIQFNKKEMAKEGSYPVINGGIEPSGYVEVYNEREDTITISQGGASAGYVNWLQTKFWAGAHCYVVCPIDEKVLDNRYLFHFVKSKEKEFMQSQYGAGIPALGKNTLQTTQIPLPPLAVQREIVRILDKFTLYSQELAAELAARKKQYEFYRDRLLAHDKVRKVALKELCINHDSKRRPITKNRRTVGQYPYYGASGIVDYVDDYLFDGQYLLISEDGANLLARSTPIAFSISGKAWVNNHAHVLEFNNKATRRYVEIYLNSINLQKYISTAAQPKLTQENLNRIEIPLPPLDIQERIVKVLDNFDAICSDLGIGLPAEIEKFRFTRDSGKAVQ